MKLHSYFRSSASYRVRIALNIKGVDYAYNAVNLAEGEQHLDSFKVVNPQSLLPVLQIGESFLTQSLAIIEYLDEAFPHRPLLPKAPLERAWVRSLALAVACDIHPLHGQRVTKYLNQVTRCPQDMMSEWACHWINEGLQALEARLSTDARVGRFCYGDEPGLADIYLVPQLHSARRLGCVLDVYPKLMSIENACNELEEFRNAMPQAQPDS